ncbi:hypothetical protein [Chitinophaga sp. CB10]|uniref:DUF7691 family protein n=1 Tax=Chitinophaga sp. CB10 TaxID=1891659 RepID=UPI0025B83A6D|nr:hypothetical protein [Chitinophaga sp. CB10]
MGYFIFSYGISFDQLNNLLGSRDDKLLKSVQQTETYQKYLRLDLPADLGTEKALKQLIAGDTLDARYAPSYWNALITLIDYQGRRLGNGPGIALNYETDLINQILQEDYNLDIEIEEVLLNGKLELGLPLPNEWPLSGILFKEDLLALQRELVNVQISREHILSISEEDEEEAGIYDGIDALKRNVAFCLENGVALVSFCY